VGGYASKDETFFGGGLIRLNRDDQTVRPNSTSLDGQVRPVLIGTPVINPRLDLGDPASPTRGGQTSNTFQFVDITTLGAFAQASYAIIPTLRVVGGIRYSSEKKEAVNFNGPTSYRGPQFPLSAPDTPEGFSYDKSLATSLRERTFKKTTYRGAVEFDVSDRVMLFANVATGFLSGSLNTAGAITEQQSSINYEAGIKSRFMDNRIQFNASVYRTEYTNLATTFQVPNAAGGVDTLSATGGELNATGFEAILDVIPIDNLRLTLSGNYLDAEYGTFGVLASGQTYRGLALQRFVDLTGFRPPYTPEITATFIASYDIDLGARGKVTPQGQVFYSDSYFAHGNLPFNRAGFQPSYTKTDLRVAYTTVDERYGLEVYVENIENEVVNQRTQSGGDGIEQVAWGFPRNYGVRLRAKF
jgi:outer membrane receptor protein involved in Fe transport